MGMRLFQDGLVEVVLVVASTTMAVAPTKLNLPHRQYGLRPHHCHNCVITFSSTARRCLALVVDEVGALDVVVDVADRKQHLVLKMADIL